MCARYIRTYVHTYVRNLKCYSFTSTNCDIFQEKDKKTEVHE